jgi:ABC-type multidrug transport system fused ATPase/permease subunit
MLAFLIKILEFAKPYRARLFLGVFVGIISGLVAPLMIATIVFVYNVIFPPVVAPGPPSKEPVWMPAAIQDWLRNVQESLNHGLHTHPGAVVALVALIPGVILLNGLLRYLNMYFLQWVAIRVVTDLRVFNSRSVETFQAIDCVGKFIKNRYDDCNVQCL